MAGGRFLHPLLLGVRALRRRELFAGHCGGLRAVNSHDPEFDLLSGPDEDIFEKTLADGADPLEGLTRQRPPARTENLKSCASCHAQEPGIHSVLSYQRVPPPDLVESDRRRQEQAGLGWKKQHYGWGLLRGLMESPH